MPDRNHRELSLTVAMLALAPILLCQGKYVRRVTPKLPEADGLRFGESGVGKPLRLLVLGDSAAAGVGVNTQQEALAGHLVKGLEGMFRVFWKVEAQTGATTRTTIARLKAATPEKFNVVAISLGVNEVTCGRRIRKWLAELDELAGLLRHKFSVQRILWSGVPAMHEFPSLPQPLSWYLGARARLLDGVLLSWTQRQPDCEFIAAPGNGYAPLMASDGFHPGPKVYELWAAEIARRLTDPPESLHNPVTRAGISGKVGGGLK
jgi:lysophospholipase L1-like esterase